MTKRQRLPSLVLIMAVFCCLTLTTLAIPLVVMAGNGMTNIMVSRADRDIIDRLNAEAAVIEDRLAVRRQVLSDIAERPDIVQGVVQTGDTLRDALDRLRVTKLLGVVKPYALYDFDGRILHPIPDDLIPYGGPLQQLAERLATNEDASSFFWCDYGDRGKRILVGVPIKFQGAIEGALLTAYRVDEIQGAFPGLLISHQDTIPANWYGHSLERLPLSLAIEPDLRPEYEQRADFINRMVIIAVVAISVISCLAWFMVHVGVIKPLRQIEQFSDAVADKAIYELPAKPPTLVRELDRLAVNLKGVGEEVLTHRQELESQVAERTEELAQQTELALQNANEAYEASQAKTDFLANMSHELRTPMNGLLGMTELLMMSELTDQQEEYLRTMNQSGQALLTIINDILDFSKISAGKMRMDPQACNIANLIYDVVSLLYGQAQAKDIELLVIYPSQLNEGLFIDSGRLRQVLTNIIGNAIKFTDRGHVLVEVSPDGPDGISIAISDTGVGMSEDELTSIFDAFVQVDRSASRRQSGTGLGLAISKRIVEMMDSQLHVSSKPGVGTTFSFALRSDPVDVTPATDQRLQSLVSSDMIAYILDEHPVRLHVLATICSGLGLTVKGFTQYTDIITEVQVKAPSHLFLHASSFDDQASLEGHLDRLRNEMAYAQSIILVAPRISLEGGMPVQVDAVLAGFLQPNHFLRSAIERAGTKTHHRLQNTAPAPTSSPSEALEPKQNQAAPTPLGDPRRVNVLVVDDNKVNRTLLRHHLKRLNLGFLEAENGREAVAIMKETNFDVILMDCAMPVLDGYQATIEIRQWEESQGEERRNIIAVTAHAMEGERERCIAAGMDGYLTKPIKADALLPVLEQYCAMT